MHAEHIHPQLCTGFFTVSQTQVLYSIPSTSKTHAYGTSTSPAMHWVVFSPTNTSAVHEGTDHAPVLGEVQRQRRIVVAVSVQLVSVTVATSGFELIRHDLIYPKLQGTYLRNVRCQNETESLRLDSAARVHCVVVLHPAVLWLRVILHANTHAQTRSASSFVVIFPITHI